MENTQIEAKVGEQWEFAYRARKNGKWQTLFAVGTISSIRCDGREIEFTNGRTITNNPGYWASEGLLRPMLAVS